MTVEKFLHFVISHNATIIEVLIGLTLLAVLFLSIRMFLYAKEPTSATGGSLDMSQLEGTLKQILERAGQIPAPVSGGSAAGSEDNQKLLVEISNLKTELEARQNQIETLKSAPAASGAPAAGLSEEEKSKLEAQIQELQAKLSEYEIISEDIADLSFYKEQNVKLQKELESLKAGGAVAAPAGATAVAAAPVEPAPSPAAPPAPPAAEPEIVGKSKVEEPVPVEPDPFAEAATLTETPAASTEAEKNLVDDDLMAEFAAAVEKQKSTSEMSAETAAPAPPPAAPVPASEATVDLGQMDMDKMLAEAADIKTDVPEVDPEKALGTSLDESKLLQEAAALEGVTGEDKKLMGDFENFVKKSES